MPCEECTVAKAKQKNMSKVNGVSGNKIGEQVYSGISTIKQQNEELPAVTKPNWHMAYQNKCGDISHANRP